MAKQARPNPKRRRRTFIREWRKSRGLTLDRLAERIGITQSGLAQIERGEVSYTQPTLEAIATALNCEPADLLMRNPTDPDAIWSVWERIKPVDRPQAIKLLKTFDDTGTDG